MKPMITNLPHQETSKATRRTRWSVLPAGLAALSLLTAVGSAAAATSLYWDANGTTGTGGSGTWQNGGSAFWNSSISGSGTLSAWNNANLDNAFFNGTPGAVTVSGTVKFSSIEFDTGGYSVSGGTLAAALSTSTPTTFFKYETGSSDLTIASDLSMDITGSGAGNIPYHIRNKTTSKLELSGNIVVNSDSTGGARFISLQNTAAGTIKLSGNISYVTNSRVSLYFGYDDSSSSSGTYIVSGSNTLGENSAVARGIVLVENNNAFNGSPSIRIGTSETDAGNSASLLTNGAYTISQEILLGRGTSATRTIGGNTANVSTFSGNLNFENTAGSVNLTAASNGRVDFSGLINDGTASSSIQKTGAGVVRLTRSAGNTYDGGTTVSSGSLLLMNSTGSATGTGAVTVATGATLGGTGRAAGLVTASGSASTFAPGDAGAIGTLFLDGGLSATSGATFEMQINGASVDLVNFGAGALSLNGNVAINFSSLGTVLTATTYNLFTGTGTWTGVDGSGLTFSFTNPEGYALNSTYGGGKGYVWDTTTHALSVQFTAVPEPGVFALLGLSAGVILIFRRRNRRA